MILQRIAGDVLRMGGEMLTEAINGVTGTRAAQRAQANRAELAERIARAVPNDGVVAALPGTPISSDQWALLKAGNVAAPKAPGLKALGIAPRPLGLFLDRWMTRYRKHGRFGVAKAA